MDIVFQAMEDIKKGQFVKLNIDTGELSIDDWKEFGLQPKEEPNIIEDGRDE